MLESDVAATVVVAAVIGLPIRIAVLGYKQVAPKKVTGISSVLGLLETTVVGEPRVDAPAAWGVKTGGY